MMQTLNLNQMILDNMTWQEAEKIVTEYMFHKVYSDIIRCGQEKSKISNIGIYCQEVSYKDYKGKKHEIEVELTLSELLNVAYGTHKKKESK